LRLDRKSAKTLDGSPLVKMSATAAWWDTENPNITVGDPLADKVQVDLHVLRALVLHGIGGEVDRADVVAVDEAGALEGAVELVEKLA
jgi:nucleoside-triphosphatase THEP1